MVTKSLVGAAFAALMLASTAASAADIGTREEAEALTERAIAAIQIDGKDKVFAAVNGKDAAYLQKDLYVFCVAFDGKTLAHGGNQALVGKDMSKLKDTDGKLFIQSQIELTKGGSTGWVDYKWTNPTTKQIEQKSSFVKKAGDDFYCGVGIYK